MISFHFLPITGKHYQFYNFVPSHVLKISSFNQILNYLFYAFFLRRSVLYILCVLPEDPFWDAQHMQISSRLALYPFIMSVKFYVRAVNKHNEVSEI